MEKFKQSSEQTNMLLSVLDERDQTIIKLRFGVGTGEKATLQEVGNILGLTRERVRQLENIAIKKISDAEKLLK